MNRSSMNIDLQAIRPRSRLDLLKWDRICGILRAIVPLMWETPLYSLQSEKGKQVVIDVTTSVAPGLQPNKLVRETFIPFLKARNVRTVLDFGAGALRHAFPLLKAGFEVCAVDFEAGFQRPVCAKALARAKRYSNFSALIWPKDFIDDTRRFDAALVCYVLQTMPLSKERDIVLKRIYKKLRNDAYLLYMSRYNQVQGSDSQHRVNDGYYKWPDRERHSFYREFTTEETHKMMARFGFKRLRSLSERGTDQVTLYGSGKSTWV